jgi:hypothetical protein
MNAKDAPEEIAKRWAEAHPGEAEKVRNILTGDFAFRECQKQRLPDDIICPACFNDFIAAMGTIDDSSQVLMKANNIGWTVNWIKGVLA